MAVGWAGTGPELLVGLDRASAEPLGQQLQRQLRDAIRTGRLQHGERLPSSRSLADQLGVSRGLVVDAYAQLESEGYLASSVGAGTHVAAGVGEAHGDGPVGSAGGAAAGAAVAPRRLDVDFEYGVPDLAAFPRRDWSWAQGVAGRTATTADLGDEHGGGSERLRTVVAAYVRRVRGSSVSADDVVVCSGFRHGLNVVLRALAGAGVEAVALEDPGPVDHDVIARRAGMAVVPVAVDERGIDVDALAASGARAVVVTPAHQCPTGVLLTADRRHALVEWARAVDGFVVEDDYDAEFRYDRQPVGSIQGLAPDRVVAVGSVSKTLVPTLRLGWMACPPALVPSLVREKHLLGRGVPGLDQLALAELIASGRYDRHLRHMRSVYGERREVLVEAVARHAPGVVVSGLAAGCHVVLVLPPGVDEQAVVDGCRERSVGVAGMRRYRADGRPGPRAELVVGFGNVGADAIRRGIRVLAEVLDGVGSTDA